MPWPAYALFVRSIGAVTDIVEKEMYSFEDGMRPFALPVYVVRIVD